LKFPLFVLLIKTITARMKKVLLLGVALLALSITNVYGQQEPQFTHFMFNRAVYNPAYVGSTQALCATVVQHNQYTRFKSQSIDGDGAPVTQTLDAHAPLPVLGGNVGVGIIAYKDQESWIGTTGFSGAGSYRFQNLPFGGQLRVGLNLGIVNKSLDAKWKPKTLSDPRLPGKSSSTAFNVGAGLYYTRTNWYVGLSTLHLTQPTIQWSEGNAGTEYNFARAVFVNAGYNYELGSKKYQLQPSILLKTDVAKTSYALNAMFLYNEAIWGAVNFRAERLNALSLMSGVYFGKRTTNFKLGLSYDIPTGQRKSFGGSLEIMGGVCVKLKFNDIIMPPPVDPLKLGRDRDL